MQGSIYNITPFDASQGTTIRFSWNGSLAKGNRCTIYSNDDMSTPIYSQKIDTYRLDHTINLNAMENGKSLKNGCQYLVFITVIDVNNVETELEPSIFYCFSSPVFGFSNVYYGQTINSVEYRFTLEYSQKENEPLNSWQIIVYDANNDIKGASGVKYNTSDMSFTFPGFVSKEKYKVRAIGETVNGITVDTGYIMFSVDYDAATIFSIVNLTNLPKIGSILITSNIVSADGKTEKDAQYIDGNHLDLRDNVLTFEEGFRLDSDFSIVTYAYNIKPNVPFFKFYANEDKSFVGTLTYRVQGIAAVNPTSYLELQVQFGEDVIYSNYITSNKIPVIDENALLGICLSRQFGHYGLRIEKLGTI